MKTACHSASSPSRVKDAPRLSGTIHLVRPRALRLAGPCQRIVVHGRVRQGFATPMPRSDPHRPGLPTASGGLARLAAQEARAAGLDLGPLLKTSGLTAAQIDDADERLSVKAQIAFVDAVARAMGRNRLGFEPAREFDLRTIGLLYYVAASSETLVEAVQRIERFSAIGNEAVVFRCSKGADLEIRLDYAGVARHSDRHQIEFFLAA